MIGRVGRILACVAVTATIVSGATRQPRRSRQYGATRLDFGVPGGRGFVILPAAKAADGLRPWVWYAPTVGSYPNVRNGWLLTRLLAKGFAICGMNVGESHGSPKGTRAFDAFYEHVVKAYGLSPKACLLPQSRGGLMLYNWAATGDNATRVQCIGGIYPVCDLRSWPGLVGATRAYGMSKEQLRERLKEFNPIDRLAPLARANVPILHLHGDADKVVPLAANSAELARRYKALGGQIELIAVKGQGHAEVPAFFHSQRLLEFFLTHGLRPIDFLKLATDFADCMIRYGRDRYGSVHSPLFSNILTREKEPRTTPYPLFADPDRVGNYKTFNRFDFNKVLNYPGGLGGEGPHKVTLYGCDPYEDRELYYTLFELTRITGEPKYRQEAEKALIWWFRNTQGPTGLYPWGEHLGWDLVHDCPTYFDGPSKLLYGACYHEIKDNVPFLDILARIPAARPGDPTPLERYALGIWRAHFWDKERAFYDRHGDYTGDDDRKGCTGGFPAHLAAYLRVWAAAYLSSKKPEFKRKIEQVFHKALDMAISRTEKHGFFPFTFDPELKGRSPGKSAPGQSIRLAHHAAELSVDLGKANPQIAAKLRRLALLHLGPQRCQEAVERVRAFRETGTKSFGKKPDARVRDLSKPAATPNGHANEIIRNVELYRHYRDEAYLKVAETYAKLALILFCDDKCPLPKARAGSAPILTTQRKPFPDFYFRGAKLMKALALLGEARQNRADK